MKMLKTQCSTNKFSGDNLKYWMSDKLTHKPNF